MWHNFLEWKVVYIAFLTEAERKKKFFDEISEAHSKYLVERLKQNDGGNGFFIGQKVRSTYAWFLLRLNAMTHFTTFI